MGNNNQVKVAFQKTVQGYVNVTQEMKDKFADARKEIIGDDTSNKAVKLLRKTLMGWLAEIKVKKDTAEGIVGKLMRDAGLRERSKRNPKANMDPERVEQIEKVEKFCHKAFPDMPDADLINLLQATLRQLRKDVKAAAKQAEEAEEAEEQSEEQAPKAKGNGHPKRGVSLRRTRRELVAA